jgi:hypothetical protein
VGGAGPKRARDEEEEEGSDEDGNGCAWRGAAGDMAAHVAASCALQQVPCPHAGCAARVPRGALAAHTHACAHRLVACAHCAAAFTPAALAAHAGRCPREPVRCPVPGCAESCVRAELVASPLGATHGPHVVVLAAGLARAQAHAAALTAQLAAAAAQTAAGAAREAAAYAALRRRPAAAALLAAAKHGNLVEFAALMRAYAGAADAHVCACDLLSSKLLPKLPLADMRAALDAGIVPLVLSALRAHPADADVQCSSLAVLGSLTKECDASRIAAGNAALEAAVAAMQHHAADDNVLELGCILVCNLTDKHNVRAAHAGAHGAIELVVEALQNGGLRAKTHGCAAMALADLTAADAADDANAVEAVRVGGVKAALDTLRRYPNDAGIMRFCGGSLERMTSTPAGRAAATAGAVGVVLKALRAHTSSVWPQFALCGVLMNLTDKHASNARAAVAGGAVDLIVTALSTHGAADAWLVRHACGALNNLFEMCASAREEARRNEHAEKALRAALAAMAHDQEASDAATEALRILGGDDR